jgi:hypothetical protein
MGTAVNLNVFHDCLAYKQCINNPPNNYFYAYGIGKIDFLSFLFFLFNIDNYSGKQKTGEKTGVRS